VTNAGSTIVRTPAFDLGVCTRYWPVDRVDRALHADLRVREVDVLAPQLGGLTQPDAGPGQQVDRRLVAVGHLLGQLLDLVDPQGGPLGVTVGARSLDPAGVAGDQLVLQRGVHDGLEQAVGCGPGWPIRPGRRAEIPGPAPPDDERRCSPSSAYHSRTTAGVTSPIWWPPIRGSMCRFQAERYRSRVEALMGRWSIHVRPNSPREMRACTGRLPGLAHQVGLDRGQVGVGVGLGPVRARGGVLQAVGPDVPRLVAPGRQLPHVAERALARLPRHHGASPVLGPVQTCPLVVPLGLIKWHDNGTMMTIFSEKLLQRNGSRRPEVVS
jgi:hypothetical protein